MRKIVALEDVSLDGVMEDPGGAGNFEHGGWVGPYWYEEVKKFQLDQLFASDALLLGRVTYQSFAVMWPSIKDEVGMSDKMNSMCKHVVSTTLSEVAWNNSRLIKGNVAEEVARLKQETGQNILIYGSGQLVQTLLYHDLIDEYQLLVYPVVLGSGKHLFQERSGRKALKLVETKPFSSGVVALSYQLEQRV